MFVLLFAAAAHAQIDPITVARILEADRVVGWAYADPPSERCVSTEYWFLGDSYTFPGAGNDPKVTVAADHEAGLETFLKEVGEQRGHLVRVDITEISRDCPGR